MQEKSLKAIDLRGYPSCLYEKTVVVLPLEKIRETKLKDDFLYGAEVSRLKDIGRIPKGFLRIFRGGEENKNRAALEEKINMLSCPYPTDYVMAGLAARKNIALEVNVSDIMNASGFLRMVLLQNLKETARLALKYRAPLVMTSGAQREEEVKNPRVLVAFGRILGLDFLQAKSCIYNIPRLVLEGVC